MGVWDRLKGFISDTKEVDYDELLPGLEDRGINVSVMASKSFSAVRDIKELMKDPITGGSLKLVLETAFQPMYDQSIIAVSSPYPVIQSALEEFNTRLNIDDYTIFMGFNTLAYGNVPTKNIYDEEYRLRFFSVIPDYSLVIPLVVGNTTIGYKFNNKFYYPHEFCYCQLMHYKDMNFIPNNYINYQDETNFVRNEWIPSPSYLSDSFRPYRVIRMIEDALLYQRLDLNNYMRIIKVKTRGEMSSKANIKTLNFYRAIFKNVRRMSYQDGISSTPNVFGREFEVVIPENENMGVTVDHIKPELDIKALRDLDIQYKKLWASLGVQPYFLGFSDRPASSGTESSTDRDDERFARKVKTLQFSVHRWLKSTMRFYLRSMGYNVTNADFNVHINCPSTVEDEHHRKIQETAADTMKKVVESFDGLGVEYNKDYLVQALVKDLFKTSGLNIEAIFDKQALTLNSSRIGVPAPDAVLLTSDGKPPVKKDRKILNKKNSLIPDDMPEVYEKLNYAHLLDDSTYKIIMAEYDADKKISDANQKIISNTGQSAMDHSGTEKVKYSVFRDAQDVYRRSSKDFIIDASEDIMLAKESVLKNCTKVNDNVTVPTPVNVFSGTTEFQAKLFNDARVETIPTAYVMDNGQLYIPSEYIPMYLFMRDSGFQYILVQKLMSVSRLERDRV